MLDTVYYTTAELSALLHCTPSKLYTLVKANRVPYTKVGATLLFDVKAITAWLAERTRPAKPI